MHTRNQSRLRCALVAALIVPLFSVAAQASAAPTTPPPGSSTASAKHFGTFYKQEPPARAARSALAAAACTNTRFSTCDVSNIIYNQYETRVVNGVSTTVRLGDFSATVTTQIRLGRTQDYAAAIVNVGPIVVTEGAPVPGDTINLEAIHNGKHAGIVQFVMSPTAGQLDDGFGYQYNPDLTTNPTSIEDFKYLVSTVGAPPTEPGVISTNISVRCDNTAYDTASVGCVNPGPTITVSMSSLPNISANVADQVSRGAPTTLHREKSKTARDANRQVFCPSSRTPSPGLQAQYALQYNDKPSCDEYPFASSKEGGGSTPGGWAWVPLKQENSKQGGIISSFFTNNRVMDNEAFVVSY